MIPKRLNEKISYAVYTKLKQKGISDLDLCFCRVGEDLVLATPELKKLIQAYEEHISELERLIEYTEKCFGSTINIINEKEVHFK